MHLVTVCPACGSLGVDEGEIREATASFRWEYCDCGWQSELRRYRLVHTKYGVEYWPDATFVRPDIVLSLKLRGRLQVDDENTGPASTSSNQYLPIAPCPVADASYKCGFSCAETLPHIMHSGIAKTAGSTANRGRV
jgi:hypothetical protein